MKNSRNLLNIGMVVFLTIFIIIFYNIQNTPENIQKLSHLDIEEITRIKIHRSEEQDIIFLKEKNGLWHMKKPYSLKAHQFRIATLLSLTQTPVEKSYNISSLDLSQYALDKPLAHIIFNDTEILFGKTNPLNNKRYFLAENKMALINDQIYPLASAQPSSFIDLSLLPENFSITKIQTPAVSILLDNDNNWINAQEEAVKAKLNADQIQSFLQHWNKAQAFAVHKYLPRKKLGQIKISSQSKRLIFQITDNDPWLILALPELNIEYHLDNSNEDILYGIFKVDQPDA